MTKTIYFSTVGLNFYKDQDIDIDDYISLTNRRMAGADEGDEFDVDTIDL